MSTAKIATYKHSLDLLRRFTPMTVEAHLLVDSHAVLLETNDPSLVSLLPFPFDLNYQRVKPQSGVWKIIRDLDLTGTPGEASILMAESLIVLSMTPACFIGADRERKEVLVFLGPDVDLKFLQGAFIPLLRRLTGFILNPEKAIGSPNYAFDLARLECHA